MKKRIFGLETEFGPTLTSQGRCALPVSRVVPYLFAQFNTSADFWNVFLENGARFYPDTGIRPEYATPECASPKDVVIYDKAGERLLETYLQYTQRKIQDEGLHSEVALFKNNTDFALRNPLQALKAIWRDLTCRKAVSLQNGQHYSALELQKAYLDLAHRYYSTHPVSATAADLLRRWEHVLTALAEDPGQLHQEIDWNYIGIGYLLHLWVKCQDLFQYENDKIAHLMRRLEGAPMVGG